MAAGPQSECVMIVEPAIHATHVEITLNARINCVGKNAPWGGELQAVDGEALTGVAGGEAAAAVGGERCTAVT